ncbi:MAG: SDR family NAD(P)-dependent oxidoreductase [Lachnospiraceae bacterium]|nr:SDR family NAD(P)-dependent oxidoreductase [Lachnospiraceae bacterium]
MKTVLITGASRGIGKEAALKFAKEGYTTYLTCSNSIYQLKEVKDEIDAMGKAPCYIFQCDAKAYDKVAEMFQNLPPLDVVVNNAGISFYGLLQDMTVAEWDQVLNTNLSSMFYTCKLCIPGMLSKGAGRIINISSIWGNDGGSFEVAYSASKGGVNTFTKALAKELAPSNIAVNAIAFGVIDTDMNGHLDANERQALIDEIPAGRFGTTKEAAEMIWQLANSPAYLTGQIITMSGGF